MKRLVICCDGTWNDLEMRYITNVGRLVQALKPHGRSGSRSISQLIYYDDGVGADANGVMRYIEGGLGIGIDAQIYNAYRFICINYEPGDEICLFGFSRGAFAVRSTAGMICKVGVVPRSELKHLPGALTAYRSKNAEQQARFRRIAHSQTVRITLLGCWDTVGALGIPDKIPFLPIDNLSRKRHEFHDTNLGAHVECALHAVAIDERRKEFNVTLMNKPKGAPRAQKLVQKWFPGDHGCIGGGTWEKRGLSNRCLHWMIDEAKVQGIEMGVDLRRLHDRAMTDYGIYYSGISSLIYGRINRVMPEQAVKWDDIDHSAHMRWVENPQYRPPALKRRFLAKLNADVSGTIRKAPVEMFRLSKGQSADVRVDARSQDNRSLVEVIRGGDYQLEVSRLQVWKDGELDACDVRGWNTLEHGRHSKIPYQDGKTANLGALKSNLIRAASRHKLVKSADWFELVMKIDGHDYQRLKINMPNDQTSPYQVSFKAKHDGELYFAANDLASRIGIIDKYDNNVGWVWIRVSRL